MNHRQSHITLLLLFFLSLCHDATAIGGGRFGFQKFNAIDKLPIDEVRCMHQDRLGFLWIGTKNGLYRYDGFHVKSYRNTERTPFLFTSDNITFITDDKDCNLWIGTKNGLSCMDMRTGMTKTYHFTDFDNCDAINRILVMSDGSMYVGTEGGLYSYSRKDDTFELLCDQRGNSKVPHSSVSCLYEGRNGMLWVGTWDRGLYRYDKRNKQWYELPPFNTQHSAQCVYEDQDGILWVGTWGSGLYKIYNPLDTGTPLRFTNFTADNTGGQLSSNIIWDIKHENITGLTWIGMPNGLAMLDNSDGTDEIMQLPKAYEPGPDFFGQGASSLFCDNSGRLWVYGTHRGIVSAAMRPTPFINWQLPAGILYTDYITSLGFYGDSHLLVGLHGKGLVVADLKSPELYTHVNLSTSVNAFATVGKDVLVCTERKGIVVLRDGAVAETYDCGNSPWLNDNCVYSLLVDKNGNWLVGTYKGLSVRYANGKGLHLEGHDLRNLPVSKITAIATDGRGYWIGTRNHGIFYMSGSIHDPNSLHTAHYGHLAGSNLKLNNISKILVDRRGKVWACSKESGLLMFSPERNGFVNACKRYGLPVGDVCTVEESKHGNIIVAMSNDLVCMTFGNDGELAQMRLFSRQDVLDEDNFSDGCSAVSPDGMVCFGGYNGVSLFNEKAFAGKEGTAKAYVTDVKVFNRSLVVPGDSTLSLLPPYGNELVLSPDQRDVTFEFSTLNFETLNGVRFSYKLDGYDSDWYYTDASESQAVYSNLPPGTYRFRLKATDINGLWSQSETTLRLVILYPWYMRWYAWVLYAVIALVVLAAVVRYFKNREQVRREVQMAHLEKQNIEELNHKKLQFFTNITHDLMTPLTIISATVSTLLNDDPSKSSSYKIIDSNVNRLMRLLQQILEFRKSETGNLHLRVSLGSLTEFFSREIESIRPLTNKKNLHLSLVCNPDEIVGFFDSDKLDKIIYNLISNAIKYNSPMGYIQVNLACIDGKTIVFTVKDNGSGIAPDKLPQLFKRFYEGEHRKFKTFGTGIGLSLTKDLVELHHGSISVESTVGIGTTFTVTLPIARDAFQPDEIDDSSDIISNVDETSACADIDEKVVDGSRATVLVVEDNEDLQAMLGKLLGQRYNVLSAYNGADALDVLSEQHVDIVLTDVMMPVMDGVELTRRIHADSSMNFIPVIMLTAKRDDEDRAEAYRAGADAYITKPFNTSVLLARIENLISNRFNVEKEINAKFFDILKDVSLSTDDEQFITLCVECVQQHLADTEFDLEAFATAVNISKSSLYKKLRALTSLSPSAFIRSIRMKYAAELLRKNPKARIADVAYTVGFNDPKYFSACFKKDFGVLPSDYGMVGEE
ncbi:MAG: ATP-binding protein [Prevotella sp.]